MHPIKHYWDFFFISQNFLKAFCFLLGGRGGEYIHQFTSCVDFRKGCSRIVARMKQNKISRAWFRQCLVVQSMSCVTLRSHGLQHARLLYPSLFPGICSNSCLLCQWCHPTVSSSVAPFSCPQSFPASGYFPMSWLFASGGQSIRASASASVLLMKVQSWFPLGLTGLIPLQSKGLSRIFSSTTIQKHQCLLHVKKKLLSL